MKVVNTYPPNYEFIQKYFGESSAFGVVFCYGDVLFNPSCVEIPDDLMIHEETHMNQQLKSGFSIDVWWNKYCTDYVFRRKIESEAYLNQFIYFCKQNTSRDVQDKMRYGLASLLSGELYGNMMSFKDALKLLR